MVFRNVLMELAHPPPIHMCPIVVTLRKITRSYLHIIYEHSGLSATTCGTKSALHIYIAKYLEPYRPVT